MRVMEDSCKKLNDRIEALFGGLQYVKIDVRFFADQDVRMRYWIGAVLRNRFLFAANQVFDENGVSLRRILDTISLPEEHFLYRYLRGGAPKGFLFDCSSLPGRGSGFTLEANRIYSFSLVIIGDRIKYKSLFMDALKIMIESGFGVPVVPLQLIGCSEESVRMSCMQDILLEADAVKCRLYFDTPVSLVQATGHERGRGFQNKLNNFPSFYQFMRSLVYRLLTLNILYSDKGLFNSKDEMDSFVNIFIAQSTDAALLSADIRQETCYSSPKAGKDSVYTMKGFIGTLCYEEVPSVYIPLILFGSDLGVGSNVNYGLGNYRVTFIQ